MKSIIEHAATFENNSDMEVKLTQTQLSRAFVNKTQWSKTCQQSNPLDDPSIEDEPPLEVSVHAYDMCFQFLTCE